MIPGKSVYCHRALRRGQNQSGARIAGTRWARAPVHLLHHARGASRRGGWPRLSFCQHVNNSLAMLEAGEFLESAEVYGNYYGTSERWIRECDGGG